MSIKYRSSEDVPTAKIIGRLKELSDAVSGGRESVSREFTMRIQAECDRDADIVIREAARRLEFLQEKYKACYAELLEIHRITASVATEDEAQEGDTLTVRRVRYMAQHINQEPPQ